MCDCTNPQRKYFLERIWCPFLREEIEHDLNYDTAHFSPVLNVHQRSFTRYEKFMEQENGLLSIMEKENFPDSSCNWLIRTKERKFFPALFTFFVYLWHTSFLSIFTKWLMTKRRSGGGNAISISLLMLFRCLDGKLSFWGTNSNF